MASTTDLVNNDSVEDLAKKDVKNDKPFNELSIWKKVVFIKNIITVEPLIIAYTLSSILCGPALLNLEYEKACRVNLQYNNTVCDAILSGTHENFSEHNTNVTTILANIHSWQSPLQTITPLILIFFLGAYSDRHNVRKPFIIAPILGEFFAVVGCILCVVFMDEWPVEAQAIAQTVVPSFFGGPQMIIMAIFSFIADDSTLEMRTIRIGIIQLSLNIITPIAFAISGQLFAHLGYYGVLAIAFFCYLFAILWGIFYLKEPKKPHFASKAEIFTDLVDPKLALDTFSLITSKKNNRVNVFLVLLLMFLYSFADAGEATIVFIYLQSAHKWTVVDLSYLQSLNTIVHLIGTSVGLAIFTKYFNFTDVIILLITFSDKIISNVILALASGSWMIYLGVVVSLFTALSAIASRSLATKVVSEDDVGKMNSMLGICEAVAGVVATPFFNQVIYKYTFNEYPPSYLFVSSAIYGLAILTVMTIHFKYKKDASKVQPTATPEGKSKEKDIALQDLQVTHM